MSHAALGPQFAEHIAAFRDRYHERGFHDPDVAAGKCDTATFLFKSQLDNAGIHSEEHEYDLDHDDEGYATNHFVNVVKHPQTGEPHVIDWTHRQFDHRADYPRVQSLEGYKADLGIDHAPYERTHPEESREGAYKYDHLHGPERDDWTRESYARRNRGSKFNATHFPHLD